VASSVRKPGLFLIVIVLAVLVGSLLAADLLSLLEWVLNL
jgi:hypothetical protein